MPRVCCPREDIDWSQSGGLIQCNWPCCVHCQNRPSEQYFTIIQQTPTTIELDVSMVPPLCLLVSWSIFPIVPVAVLMGVSCGNYHATSWRFVVTSSTGPEATPCLSLIEKSKYLCTESEKIIISNIQTALVETHKGYEAERGENWTGRIVITGYNRVEGTDRDVLITIHSPRKQIVDNQLDLLCERILAMIPVESGR